MKPTILVAALCLCLGALVACNSEDKAKESMMTSPGAVSECSPGCKESGCAGKCSAAKTCPASGEKASMGAVGDAKASGCCKSKSATSTCPASTSGDKTSMGAVSDTKASGCCKSAKTGG